MKRRPFPNESIEYRKARDELAEAEGDLRAQVEHVAELRRALPLGGEIGEDYLFEEAGGKVKLSELFAPDRDTLLIYGFMYGPNMEAACPMCTSFLDSLNGAAPHLAQRINLAVSARSPIDRIMEHARGRDWSNLRMLSSSDNGFQFDYLAEGEDGSQWPMANVFVRREGRIHHFWATELFFRSWPGDHPRHVDMLWPLWNVLDLTPEGRGDFFPALEY